MLDRCLSLSKAPLLATDGRFDIGSKAAALSDRRPYFVDHFLLLL
jgi:hypothetical protein